MSCRAIRLILVLPNTIPAKHCGVKAFYLCRSNPDGYSVNFRCVDSATFAEVVVTDFDGQNWEENAGALAHLSQDSSGSGLGPGSSE